jgi:hypothetical protein
MNPIDEKGGVIVPLSVSYKHFGRECGEEIGEVVIFDLERVCTRCRC